MNTEEQRTKPFEGQGALDLAKSVLFSRYTEEESWLPQRMQSQRASVGESSFDLLGGPFISCVSHPSNGRRKVPFPAQLTREATKVSLFQSRDIS